MKLWLSLPENGATERFINRRGWKVGDMAAYLEVECMAECSPEVLMYHRALNTSVFDEVNRVSVGSAEAWGNHCDAEECRALCSHGFWAAWI